MKIKAFIYVTSLGIIASIMSGCLQTNSRCVKYEDRPYTKRVCERYYGPNDQWKGCASYKNKTFHISTCVKRVCKEGYVRINSGQCVKRIPISSSSPVSPNIQPSRPQYSTAPSTPYLKCARVRRLPQEIVASDKGVIVRKVYTCQVNGGKVYYGKIYVIYNATYTPRVCNYAYYDANGRIRVVKGMRLMVTNNRYRIKTPNGHANKRSALKCR